ncbi:MAG TPA: glycosyltransferase family 2 protein [Thermosynechococcaceae cyanobacterium]
MENKIGDPKVSIVTPSYNQGHFIEKTIISVLGQDYPNLEYIVLDSASNDRTGEVLDKYSSYIDIVIREKDKGQADAINRGFQLSSGEILAYLNSDDCYANQSVVSTVVKHLQADPEIDVIYGQRQFIDEDGYFRFCYPIRPFCEKNLYLSCYMHQESTFWRRSIYEKAGGFVDESYQFAMDYELWMRFLKFGAKVSGFDDVFGLFRYYDNQKSTAQWQQVGLPEIERVYRQYSDRCLPEKEMIDCHQEYFFGANPSKNPDSYRFAYDLWASFVAYKKNLLKQPIDTWGFNADLSHRKLR